MCSNGFITESEKGKVFRGDQMINLTKVSGYVYFQETKRPNIFLFRKSKHQPDSGMWIKVKDVKAVQDLIFCQYYKKKKGNNLYELNTIDFKFLKKHRRLLNNL